jgi:hypothetical protein
MAAEPKTKPTEVPVGEFIAAVDNPKRRADAGVMVAMLADASGEPPVMWGPSIVGYGTFRGPTGDWPIIGFSPRKAQTVVYIMPGFTERDDLMARLGKHKTGGSCLYINKLEDVDLGVLRELATWAVAWMREKYPA